MYVHVYLHYINFIVFALFIHSYIIYGSFVLNFLTVTFNNDD